MKIRLIIPICEDDEIVDEYYCRQGIPDNFSYRIRILQNAMEYNKDGIDLVVTSHDYFIIHPSCIMGGKEFVEDFIIKNLKRLRKKKPLIFGFDLFNDRIKFNPFNGIDAIVGFVNLNKKNSYIYESHIWECWSDKTKCDEACFVEQNPNRSLEIKRKRFCLLSCGDIMGHCHNNGKTLPNSNIYISLTHMNFKRKYIKAESKDESNIQKWKRNRKVIVIVTQQLSKKALKESYKNFFKSSKCKKYQLIWPTEIRNKQKLWMFKKNHIKVDKIEEANYLFIDIKV